MKLKTGKYQYRLKQLDYNLNYQFFILSSIVKIGVPPKFYLSQNYSNPFNPLTKIDYDLPFDTKVSILIFDVLGKDVKKLVNEFHTAGYYSVVFDATALSSGVYYYRIMTEGGEFIMTKKMVVLK